MSPSPHERVARLRNFWRIWENSTGNERATFQPWFLGLCEAMDVAVPVPPTADYRFELPVRVVDREGREATNFIDCWKTGQFALEAKAFADVANIDAQMRKAFGQLRNYVAHVSGNPPPYLMVVDVPRTLIIWDRWSGSYGDFAAGRRIALATLHESPDDASLLYDILAQPHVRDPRGRAQAVTKDIAAGLAQLATRMEARGLETERVARFLMRCVFSCFAEDVGLLPPMLFRRTLETARASREAEHLARALTLLWRTMDEGGMFGAEILHRFNGHFFRTVEALPLEAEDVLLLIDAAKHDWSQVEPSIFGTLLVRALDPQERHRLGAEYTPREYIERLVEPTIVEPLRERWTAVQAAALQLEQQAIAQQQRKKAEPQVINTKKRKTKGLTLPKQIVEAVDQLLEFHEWLRGLSFLDPACGSGNFLYVTMAAVKRIEFEVLNEIHRLSEGQGGLVLQEVHPRQFHGIEVNRWAREVAELTLWIGYHQFWRETHGGRTPPDPILEDTGTIEHRDAVLAWDSIVHRPERDRPDPTPRIVHPVTGELVPDPAARLPYFEYVGARPAQWPKADFIVGNPPYIGGKRIRAALGDGYTDALQRAYPELPDAADFVMYWWDHAARRVAKELTERAGLITTNSLRQRHNRPVVDAAFERGVGLAWAVGDHPWVDEADGAAVRVALTVLARSPASTRLHSVLPDNSLLGRVVTAINADLSSGADLATAVRTPLASNQGLCHFGFILNGPGFILDEREAHELINYDVKNRDIIKPIVGGKDITARPSGDYVVDFGQRTQVEAREYPLLYNIVVDRVKPSRDANRDRGIRENWWRFHRIRQELREAVAGLNRFIVTVETMKHRVFTYLPSDVAPDHSLACIAIQDGMHHGVLCSSIHIHWALAAGARLGVGNDPRYTKTVCFDPFPFPDPASILREDIAVLAERLDAHRKDAIARDERVTMTGMYNVIEKLRSGEPLTAKERTIHEITACGVLRDLHDALDARVAEAYGWTWPMEKEEILERLVALHDERVAEERSGRIRWLRPDYQIPRFAPHTSAQTAPLLDLPAVAIPPAKSALPQWPSTAVDQFAEIAALLSTRTLSVDQVASAFTGSRRDLIQRHLETLELMGEVTQDIDGRFGMARKAG
jgi:hypothetical protein